MSWSHHHRNRNLLSWRHALGHFQVYILQILSLQAQILPWDPNRISIYRVWACLDRVLCSPVVPIQRFVLSPDPSSKATHSRVWDQCESLCKCGSGNPDPSAPDDLFPSPCPEGDLCNHIVWGLPEDWPPRFQTPCRSGCRRAPCRGKSWGGWVRGNRLGRSALYWVRRPWGPKSTWDDMRSWPLFAGFQPVLVIERLTSS